MYKLFIFVLLACAMAMCNTDYQNKEVALFIRICDSKGQNCITYMPTKNTTLDTTNLDVIEFVEDNDNVFFGEKSANYTFLSYISKDTLTILIDK